VASPRRSTTTVLVALSLIFGIVPAGAHDADDLRQEIERTQEAADAARGELGQLAKDLERTEAAADDAAQRVAIAEADLAAITAKLNARKADLAVVEEHLAAATERLETAEAALELARTVAANEEARARRSEALVDQKQKQLDRQVASIYKYGRASEASRWIAAVKSSDSINQLGHTTQLLKDASAEQTRILDRMRQLRDRAEADRAEAHAARVSADVQRDEAADAHAEVEGLVVEQQELVAAANALADQQRSAVATLERERQSLQAQATQISTTKTRTAEELKDLEKEEAKLEAELKALLAGPKVSGPAPGMLQFPTAGRVGSRFGYRIHPIYGYARLHAGVDIGAPTGQVIVSAESGQVVRSGWCGGYGNCVVVQHSGGLATLYAHMSQRAVGVGTWVRMGQAVGYIGSTGLSTGPHLHFETRVNGTPVDPCRYLSEC
jgi:murein DD-endopeptidase MepM/ murein hydrolase activator NlpD